MLTLAKSEERDEISYYEIVFDDLKTGIELATPGPVVRHATVVRHVTDCATRPRHIL